MTLGNIASRPAKRTAVPDWSATAGLSNTEQISSERRRSTFA